MAIEWDDVRVFQSAVRAGDYSSAGRKLDMNRTTVGRRFARLERAAGRPLWEQAAEGYRPTSAGRSVLRAAAQMERAMTRLSAELDGAATSIVGPLRVAGTAGLVTLLLPAMPGFLGRHPQILLEVVGARDAAAAVQQRHADIGFAIARTRPPGLDGARLAAFEQRRYRRIDGATDRAVGWGHALLLANPQGWARLNALSPDAPGLEVDGLAALWAAVSAGLGHGWLWRALGDADARLQPLPGEPPPSADASIWLVHRGDLAIEPAVAALRQEAAGIIEAFLKLA